jgi:L-seryl-tRNA(Ser) seleniumtransferase
MSSDATRLLAGLPAVDKLLQEEVVRECVGSSSRALVVTLLRESLDALRKDILAGRVRTVRRERLLKDFLRRWHRLLDPYLRKVFNCTGVILHTGLGRAPVPQEALRSIAGFVGGYTNLEFNLETGRRGQRNDHVELLLKYLTGAEAAVVVNNNAAAVYLVLNTLASRREVLVSRGQLVEIGGKFRVPDILKRSGARMVEVGTTNKTHLEDYEQAFTPRTGMILRVHTSNFRQVGFVHQPQLAELTELAHTRGVILVDDLGSGAFFPLKPYGFTDEPLVTHSVARGADLVTFSGDKLLGGGQAGIIVGRKDLVSRLKKSPLMRVLRPDKFTLAILETTLRHYLAGEPERGRVPVVRMLTEHPDRVRERGAKLLKLLRIPSWLEVALVATQARTGSGALPEEPLPSWGLRLTSGTVSVERLARKLRLHPRAVVGYIHDEALLLDLKAVSAEEVEELARELNAVLGKMKQGENGGLER